MRPYFRYARRVHVRVIATSALLFSATFAGRAHADDPLTVEEAQALADEVEIDTRGRELHLKHNVEVALPPFVLRSDELTISRGKRGLAVEGDGRLNFCPCLGTPVALGFSGASVAPPGDLFLGSPTLRLLGVPVFWLPYFWLRSPARAGLLPPRVAYRGKDGFFVGGGVQFPFASVDAPRRTWPIVETEPDRSVVLRAGAYTTGGLNVTAAYYSATSTDVVEYDVRGNAGVKLALNASDPAGGDRLAYEVNAYRGARSLDSTTDLEQAARAFDRGRIETRAHDETGGARVYGFGGVSGLGVRGRDYAEGVWTGPEAGAGLDAVLGPRVFVHGDASALGRARTAYDVGDVSNAAQATAESSDVRSLAIMRANARIEGSLDAGPFDVGVAAGGAGAFGGVTSAASALATDTENRPAVQGIAFARVEPSVPLGRTFGEDLLHRLEPGLVALGAIEHHASAPDALLDALPTRAGAVGAFGARVRSVLGAWGTRDAWLVDAMGGALVDRDGHDPFVRARSIWGARWLGFGADGGATFGDVKSSTAVASVRVGRRDRASLTVRAAHVYGSRTDVLRMLDEGEAWMRYGYLAAPGLTGGATFRATHGLVALTLGSDVDAERKSLLGVRGDLVVQDHCECIAVRLGASRRLGRDGVDAWVLFDFGESVRRYRK